MISIFGGGGLKQGHIHGAIDDFGHRAVQDVVTQHEFHATLLHQFGLKSEELHYEHNAQPVALVEPGQGKVATGLFK